MKGNLMVRKSIDCLQNVKNSKNNIFEKIQKSYEGYNVSLENSNGKGLVVLGNSQNRKALFKLKNEKEKSEILNRKSHPKECLENFLKDKSKSKKLTVSDLISYRSKKYPQKVFLEPMKSDEKFPFPLKKSSYPTSDPQNIAYPLSNDELIIQQNKSEKMNNHRNKLVQSPKMKINKKDRTPASNNKDKLRESSTCPARKERNPFLKKMSQPPLNISVSAKKQKLNFEASPKKVRSHNLLQLYASLCNRLYPKAKRPDKFVTYNINTHNGKSIVVNNLEKRQIFLKSVVPNESNMIWTYISSLKSGTRTLSQSLKFQKNLDYLVKTTEISNNWFSDFCEMKLFKFGNWRLKDELEKWLKEPELNIYEFSDNKIRLCNQLPEIYLISRKQYLVSTLNFYGMSTGLDVYDFMPRSYLVKQSTEFNDLREAVSKIREKNKSVKNT